LKSFIITTFPGDRHMLDILKRLSVVLEVRDRYGNGQFEVSSAVFKAAVIALQGHLWIQRICLGIENKIKGHQRIQENHWRPLLSRLPVETLKTGSRLCAASRLLQCYRLKNKTFILYIPLERREKRPPVDPGEPLAAAAQRAASKDIEDGQHARQGAAFPSQHDAEAHHHLAVHLQVRP
jgi:hypothetical protein